jgi:hypothetical protein
MGGLMGRNPAPRGPRRPTGPRRPKTDYQWKSGPGWARICQSSRGSAPCRPPRCCSPAVPIKAKWFKCDEVNVGAVELRLVQ